MQIYENIFKKLKFGGTFGRPIFLYFANYQCYSSSIQRFLHRVLGVGFGFFGEVDVGSSLFVVYTEESAKWHIYISPISLTVEVSSAVLATSNLTRSFFLYHLTVSGLSPKPSAICGVV